MAPPPFLDVSEIRKLKPEILLEFEDWSFGGVPRRGLYHDAFGNNIHSFLQECGDYRNYAVADMPQWRIVVGGANGINLPLYIMEEIVQVAVRSRNPFCDHCKSAGWGHHFVSKSRFHLIIPEYDKWGIDLKDDCFDIQTHLLYGLIHCNGYGHLICINGVNENSDFPSKNDVMNLWDWICTMLRTRAISVCDVMDVKLLHILAFGKSWYGKWGYEFTGKKHETAVNKLRSHSLAQIEIDLGRMKSRRKLRQVVDKYRKVCNIPMDTIGDVLNFMLAFEARGRMDKDLLVTSLAKNFKARKNFGFNERKIENVLTIILDLLMKIKAKNDGRGVVSMQELRDETKRYLESRNIRNKGKKDSEYSELIHVVLRAIRFLKIEDHMISLSTSSSTKRMEFKIYEVLQEAKLEIFPYYGTKFDCSCRWTAQRVKQAAAEIVKILNNGNTNTEPQQELDKKARKIIDDTQLIAFLLNSMDGAMIGNQIVSRSQHPVTQMPQFAVQDIVIHDMIDQIIEAGENVDEDVLFFYKTFLFGSYDSHSVALAIRNLLESQNCVKEWPLHKQGSKQLPAFSFKVIPRSNELKQELARPFSPGVPVLVPPHIAKRRLKQAVQSALRKTYFVMENFEVAKIVGIEKLGDDEELFCILLPGYTRDASVEGTGLDLKTELIYEDGERLVECIFCDAVDSARCSDYKATMYIWICENCDGDE